MTAELEGGEWSAARPGCTLTPGKDPVPILQEAGGPQGRSGRSENLVLTGIRSRTVQPVVSPHNKYVLLCFISRTVYSKKRLLGRQDIFTVNVCVRWSVSNAFSAPCLFNTLCLCVVQLYYQIWKNKTELQFCVSWKSGFPWVQPILVHWWAIVCVCVCSHFGVS